MAGGVPSSAPNSTPAPVPSGKPLDGSPAFQAAAPVAEASSAPVTTGTNAPTTLPAMPGMSFMGFPSWLGGWSGANYGSPGAPSTGGSTFNFGKFVPGTGLSGYAAHRAPQVFQPPPPPPKTTTPTNTGAAGMDLVWNPAGGFFVDSKGKGVDPSSLTPEQKAYTDNMRRWMESYGLGGGPNWQAGYGGNSSNGSGGLY